MTRALIAYISETGTTQRAAKLIAEELEKNEIYTTTLPLDKAGDPEGYDHVIIGGPIQGMRWHKNAMDYVTVYKESLKETDVSFFAMSYIYFTGKNFWKKKIEGSFAGGSLKIKPEMTGIFPGKIDKELPGAARWIFGIPKGQELDLQNDSTVREWAIKWIEKRTT